LRSPEAGGEGKPDSCNFERKSTSREGRRGTRSDRPTKKGSGPQKKRKQRRAKTTQGGAKKKSGHEKKNSHCNRKEKSSRERGLVKGKGEGSLAKGVTVQSNIGTGR